MEENLKDYKKLKRFFNNFKAKVMNESRIAYEDLMYSFDDLESQIDFAIETLEEELNLDDEDEKKFKSRDERDDDSNDSEISL